ncbi:hypothetical protein LAZ67_3006009 [Cordylochernes scorpioides]|uniref:Uncharacterized protein n=1 Tax=Cordylochernes scorpioides TaxID=51811 RepID=A0ABY6KAT4_9ARAC|nr:hypothetical protein LAZ67_3006009 [Cordylochernes scorpioides]
MKPPPQTDCDCPTACPLGFLVEEKSAIVWRGAHGHVSHPEAAPSGAITIIPNLRDESNDKQKNKVSRNGIIVKRRSTIISHIILCYKLHA